MPKNEFAPTVLTVDIDAVVGNWRSLRDRVDGARCAAVVKADSYGLGADKIAPALLKAGCADFFVALLDEAVALRPLVPWGRIFVLGGPLPGEAAAYRQHELVPVLNSPEQMALWQAEGEGRPCAVHVDTGMNRLGLAPGEAAARIAAHRGLNIALLMSHLACGDEPDHPLNRRQLDLFGAVRVQFPEIPASLSASSGIFLGSEWHFDLVRPGISLYGGSPTGTAPNPMAPVVHLAAKILQVRDVDEGSTVGYGASHRLSRSSRLATVAIGYADGWLRSFSNRCHGVLQGVRVPLVGRVSMDLCIFDVTDAPEGAARPGNAIEVLNAAQTIDVAAASAGTISYEILTSLSGRYGRVYKGV